MKVVNVKDLKIKSAKGRGYFSKVYLVELDGKLYCFKKFKCPFADDTTINKLCNLTELDFDKHFLVPLHMVESKSGGFLIGYLTAYDEKLVKIRDPFKREEIIKLLKSVRANLDILHNQYKLVHGDLHFGNILCNKELLQTYLLDFDFARKVGELPSSFENYGLPIQEYIKYYSFDEKADIYYFNLSTFKLLVELYLPYYKMMDFIENGEYYFPEMNNDVKRLAKELILPNKKFSGEYIIDYI